MGEKPVEQSYKVREPTNRRACWASSFGLDYMNFCDCNGKEAQKCKEKYKEQSKANLKRLKR